MLREQAITEWTRRVISIVTCCHSLKLCAHAARAFHRNKINWNRGTQQEIFVSTEVLKEIVPFQQECPIWECDVKNDRTGHPESDKKIRFRISVLLEIRLRLRLHPKTSDSLRPRLRLRNSDDNKTYSWNLSALACLILSLAMLQQVEVCIYYNIQDVFVGGKPRHMNLTGIAAYWATIQLGHYLREKSSKTDQRNDCTTHLQQKTVVENGRYRFFKNFERVASGFVRRFFENTSRIWINRKAHIGKKRRSIIGRRTEKHHRNNKIISTKKCFFYQWRQFVWFFSTNIDERLSLIELHKNPERLD